MNVLDAIGNTTLVPSEGGRTTKKLILDMIEVARALSREPKTYWTDQLNNHDAIAGYYGLGEEIWRHHVVRLALGDGRTSEGPMCR